MTTCYYCGETVVNGISRADSGMYCSTYCRDIVEGDNNPEPLETQAEFADCEECGQTFVRTDPYQMLCSRSCAAKKGNRMKQLMAATADLRRARGYGD